MADADEKTDGILTRLSREFAESAQDQLQDIEGRLNLLNDDLSNADEILMHVQREIHNIKGQGSTFGYPTTGRVAHMLEDYLLNMEKLKAFNLPDIQTYLDLMEDLIASGETIAGDDTQKLLNDLPSGHVQTFSTQEARDISVLLVMPVGLQRKMVAQELLSCGFRVMRAYDCVEALSVAVDMKPHVVFLNYDMTPFSGRELCNVFAAIDDLRDMHVILLSSHEEGSEQLQGLPPNVSLVQKHKDFTESIGELLIDWGIFGNIPN